MRLLEWIDSYILGLIDLYDTCNIYELFDYLNIKIKKLDKDNVLLQHNEAFYNRFSSSGEIIFIRDDLPANYEKFILAHELAHAIIHVSLFEAAFNIELINNGKLELQANYFAFKLTNIFFDETELQGMTIEQIANCLELPCAPLKQVVNL